MTFNVPKTKSPFSNGCWEFSNLESTLDIKQIHSLSVQG